jgi:hypothetical protein
MDVRFEIFERQHISTSRLAGDLVMSPLKIVDVKF